MSSPVVLAFITKNSATKLAKTSITLFDVLKSTLQIPYRSIILVDASTDETVDYFRKFCDEYGKELVLVRGGRTRGEARQIAIDIFLNNFTQEWLMFVDDDVILNPGWWSEAEPHTKNPRVGIIWGVNYDHSPERARYLKILGVDYVQYLVKEFFHRGGTHDTMLRREAIKDIKIPPELHYYEDGYILRHVLNKGYEARIVYTGCTHYNPWTEEHLNKNELRRMAYLAKKYGFEQPSWKRLFRSLLSFIPHLVTGTKTYGLVGGIRYAYRRWKAKVLFRWYLLTTKVYP